MTENEKRMHRACFTGHRPEKLMRSENAIRKDLEKQIRQAVTDGLNVFISGMARGVDIWAAQIVLKLRNEGTDVKLICACPYKGFELGWSREWQQQYKEVLESADFIKAAPHNSARSLSQNFCPNSKFQKWRNTVCISHFWNCGSGVKRRLRLEDAIARCCLKYVCADYSRACFQIRNEWMVNHAVRVIAIFNGEKGGTKNTMDYAAKIGVPVVHIKG